MTTKKMTEMAEVLLNELASILKEIYGDGLITKIAKTKLSTTLYTEDFFISYDIEDNIFNISFIVGLSGMETAKYMTCVLSVFEVNEIQFLSDSYYDKENNELVFGQEAIEAKQKDILESLGKCKCVMCELVYPIEYIEQNVCVKCKKSYDKFNWH